MEKYPLYATPEKLEPFKRLDFSGPKYPEKFLKFCQQAIQQDITPSSSNITSTQQEHDSYFKIEHYSSLGFLWRCNAAGRYKSRQSAKSI